MADSELQTYRTSMWRNPSAQMPTLTERTKCCH